ncbi:MAG: GerW family sporulation protein [Oscillospiraceae bacterium]|nr:GerW family sporulation protein [Oscillospiraceae bacterium]
MSKNLPEMLENTISKIRNIMDSNTVIGEPITVGENVTIIPVSKVSIGCGGGGSDFATKNAQGDCFGGGLGGGVKITPVAFLVIQNEHVRMLPVATPANTTADRLVEMIPDTLDKIVDFIDSRVAKKDEE